MPDRSTIVPRIGDHASSPPSDGLEMVSSRSSSKSSRTQPADTSPVSFSPRSSAMPPRTRELVRRAGIAGAVDLLIVEVAADLRLDEGRQRRRNLVAGAQRQRVERRCRGPSATACRRPRVRRRHSCRRSMPPVTAKRALPTSFSSPRLPPSVWCSGSDVAPTMTTGDAADSGARA